MKVAFHTLGCKVNQYESNAMAQEFKSKGYTVVHDEQDADIAIVNTCTVTNTSDNKSLKTIRKVLKNHENVI